MVVFICEASALVIITDELITALSVVNGLASLLEAMRRWLVSVRTRVVLVEELLKGHWLDPLDCLQGRPGG